VVSPASVRVTRAIEFSSSLRLWSPELSPEENRRLYGQRASKHGHNFRLELTVEGEPDPRTGMVMDLAALKDLLEREVMARFDHRDLNDDTPWFEKRPPTPENLALVIRQVLLEALPSGMLARIRLAPDEDHWVELIEAR